MDAQDNSQKYFCPRLLDYIVIVGSRHPNRNNAVAQTPEMLRRYPMDDHKDFPLPPDVVFFCQPEGCISVGPKRISLRESTSFVFTLTEKDSGRMRYGICVNFYRPIDRRTYSRSHSGHHQLQQMSADSLSIPQDDDRPKSPRTRRKIKTAGRVRTNTLTSLCIISHHPFFSTFRECLFVLRKIIDACNERSSTKRIGGSKSSVRDTVWGVLTGLVMDNNTPSLVMHEVREIETWILRLLSAPVPVPGKTRVEVSVLPTDLHAPLTFALPDHTRFSLVDFPLHLPLELLGVETCVQVLTCILLEHKLILQSRDYNALTMSVMAFVSMLYPLEYMFPVIPLLPTCMGSAEQLLLAPTPFIIGVPSSFLMYKKGFALPDDIWLVDLDSNRITNSGGGAEELPSLPEPEGTVLKNHLKQRVRAKAMASTMMKSGSMEIDLASPLLTIKKALASMSMTPQPIKDLETLAQNPEMWQRRDSFSSATGFNPLIYGNDVDSVDVATRVAMVRFFNSPNVMGHFQEHTRTLRLYPRPVVAFQLNGFMKSRPVKTVFTNRLARTQAVEYFAEFALSPTNVVFLRVQTGVYDPLLIGDKAKWYSQGLQKIDFQVINDPQSTLGLAVAASLESERDSDENPTDESGSDSDGAESTSSSYSSLSDFVFDIQNSDIVGETGDYKEDQVMSVDASRVYAPPDKLQVPDDDVPVSNNSDSALSAPDSDDNDSEASSSPTYAKEPPRGGPPVDRETGKCEGEHFRYDNLNQSPSSITPTSGSRDGNHFRYESGGNTPVGNVTPTSRGPHTPPMGRTQSMSSTPPKTPPPRPEPPKRPFPSRSQTVDAGGQGRRPGTPPRPERPPNSPSLRSQDSAYSSQRQDSIKSGFSFSSQMSSSTVQSMPLKQEPRNINPNIPGAPGVQRGDSMRSNLRSQKPSLQPGPSTVRAPRLGQLPSQQSPDERAGSLIQTLSSELNDISQTAQSTFQEIFGNNKGQQQLTQSKPSKHYAPLGNRKALVEKSGLVKHATNKKQLQKQPSVDQRNNQHSQNQQFLKDIVSSVLEGQGVGFWKLGRVKTLMEDENYRNFVVSRLNTTLDRKLSDEDMHLEDVTVTKPVFKGMLTMVKALIQGLELTYQNQGMGGMASAFMVLEIIHTHFWEKDIGSSRSDTSNPSLASSPFGSRESLSSLTTQPEAHRPTDLGTRDELVPSMGVGGTDRLKVEGSGPATINRAPTPQAGSPVIVNGDEFENIEMRRASDILPASSRMDNRPQNGHSTTAAIMSPDGNDNSQLRDMIEINRNLQNLVIGAQTIDVEKRDYSSGYASESGDMLRELVKNKELMRVGRKKELTRFSSVDSDVSEGSTLVSTGSDMENGEKRKRPRINHHAIRSTVSDTDVEQLALVMLQFARKKRSGSILSTKSAISSGHRYHEGRLLTVPSLPSPDSSKTYLFEHVIGKDRSWLWDQMQFWEDAFLDAVATERDIIGMDQGPTEMMERYNSLGDTEKKRLEHDEDRLLAILLYNMIGFMVMMRVSKNETRRKVRRMLGKCHIGLAYSQEINNLLDQINNLTGNDIDLKPAGSRLMQKQSFTVHWGPDNTGDMLFMEVCDDCLILRSVTGAICDRWWYEKLVNMTYCPKTKVLCLWRKHGDKTQLNKFYTKKCKELYFCVKDAMEKAAARNNGKVPGPELGGEFPVQDMKSGQGGLLQVCMEGIGLLFANSKFFIELSRIKKCFTQKGGIFVLEEFDSKTRKVIQRKYKSNMAGLIALSLHRVISCHPDLFARPRDPRLSCQSSSTLDSDVADDTSLSESNSTVISMETTEGRSACGDSDRLNIEEPVELNEVIAKEELADNIKSDENVQIQENKNTSDSGKKSEPHHTPIDNSEAVDVSSHQLCNASKTINLDVITDQAAGDANRKTFDMNSNVNENDNINNARRINEVDRDLNENYSFHSENHTSS